MVRLRSVNRTICIYTIVLLASTGVQDPSHAVVTAAARHPDTSALYASTPTHSYHSRSIVDYLDMTGLDPRNTALPRPVSLNFDIHLPVIDYLPDNRPREKIPVVVKGIYMTGWVAGVPRLRSKLISLIDRTELNAVVLDVKDDKGMLTDTAMGIPLAQQIGAAHYKAPLPQVLQELLAHAIYPIARIVCFKDELLARKRVDLAVRTPSGGIWHDYNGMSWVDPYNREVWDYNIAVAKAAARLGFREIQFDYVRFVSDGDISTAVYPAKHSSREDAIKSFLDYAKEELASYNVFISADVFGLTTSATDDLTIGQKFEKVSSAVDYICPMTYPSHYARGTYGISYPNAAPYETLYRGLTAAVPRTHGAIIRPWLQDFSLGPPVYTAAHILAQIQAVYDAGLQEWILWNPSNVYTEGALAPSRTRQKPSLASQNSPPTASPHIRP